jgi:hypothetical protein
MANGLNAALGQDRMTPALFRPPATPAAAQQPAAETPVTGRVTSAGIMGAQAKETETRQKLLQRQGEIAAAEAQRKAEAGAEQAAGMAAAEQAYRQELQPTIDQLRQANKMAAEQRFAPSQRTAQENAALFGLISVIGFAIGAGGKSNAMSAMSAMNGMLEGVRKGDMDRYAKEKESFNTNLNVLRNTVRGIESELKNVIAPLAVSNKEEARLKLAELLARKDATFLRQYADKFSLPQLIKLSEDTSKSMDRAFQLAQRLESGEEQARIRAQAQITRAMQPRAPAPERPTTPVRVVGPDGKETMIRPTYDETGMMVLPEGYKLSARGQTSPSGPGGAIQFRYNQAMTNAGLQLATAVGNLADMPMKGAPPLLAEVLTNPTKGVTDAVVQYLGQNITSEDSRAMQQVLAGMSRAITTIEASGRPSGATEASIKEFGKVAPRAGDRKINYYLFLAESKQVMEILVKDLIAAGANKDQIAFATQARDEVAKVVTWNVRDINRILASGKERLVNDRIRQQLQVSDSLRRTNEMVTRMEQAPAEQPQVAAAPAPAAAASQPTHTLRGRPIVVRDGKWVFQDTGEEAK